MSQENIIKKFRISEKEEFIGCFHSGSHLYAVIFTEGVDVKCRENECESSVTVLVRREDSDEVHPKCFTHSQRLVRPYIKTMDQSAKEFMHF